MISINECAESRARSSIFDWSGASGVWCSTSIMPITPFIGVRISWLIVATNADLARLACSASWRACSRSAMMRTRSPMSRRIAVRFFVGN